MLIFILLPMLVSFLMIPLLGERLVKSYVIAVTGALVSLGFSVYYFITIFGRNAVESYNWFDFGGHSFTLSLTGGNLNLFLAVLVSFVSLMVLIFSVFYMKKEKQERYYAEMSVFILSMLGLVLSNSLLLFYVFWEIVGVSSYLLIGFWYEREKAAAAGKKALIMTRIGDMALLAAMVLLFVNLGTFSISAILSSISSLPQPVLFASAVLIMIAAFSKSAQFPFYTWLPDAMEGPTPVSALLHSATMVAAGAYLLVAFLPMMSAAGLGQTIITVAMITAFFGALLGLKETHFKRILAYSTIESLSFMFMSIGTFNAGGAIFYLATHALFKSLLFLVSGVIAILIGTQEIYQLRGRGLRNSWLFIPAIIGFSSLAGLPPFMSFFAHISLTSNFNVAESLVFTIVSFLTALFSFRAFFVIFRKKTVSGLKKSFSSVAPIILLSILSVIGGLAVISFSRIINLPYRIDVFDFISLAAAVAGVLVAYTIFYRGVGTKIRSSLANAALRISGYGYDRILDGIGEAFMKIGRAMNVFDSALNGFYRSLGRYSLLMSSNSRKIEDGDAQTYITAILVGLLAVIAVAVVFV